MDKAHLLLICQHQFHKIENVVKFPQKLLPLTKNCIDLVHDIYGFVYRMLNLPIEMFTPIFALARISGWSAHRIEEIVNAGKIIRPAIKMSHPVKLTFLLRRGFKS